MHTEYRYAIGACVALLVGLLIGLYWRGLVSISCGRPAHYSNVIDITAKVAHKKEGKLFFWNKDKWHHEAADFLISSDVADSVAHIANKWLALLEEEGVLKKRVMVTHVLLNASGSELYISFDRYLFNKESSAYEKWMCIEGLLKTLRENGITVAQINFKVRHESLRDYHLDFSSPWPLLGFVSN